MKNQKEYVVNVGNIGNITCDTRKEAEQVYNKYVAMSKSGKGRAGNEHVSLMIDGEPVKEHFADKEEYAKGSTIDKSLPEKLYVSCHLGNTFEYLKENKAYIHGLSSSENHDFIAYKNTINYKKSMDEYELEFDVKKMLNLGFKIQNLNELYPDVGFGKDAYKIIVPEKYIIKGTKDEKGYTIKSDLLKDVKDYITKVNVLLNNYSLVDIDWTDDGTAESDYGQKEFIEKNGKTNLTINYINKVNKGDKMSKVMTWGSQSYAKGTNVTKFSDYGSYWNAVVDYIYKENKGKIERSVIEDEANKSDALLQNMFNEEDFNLDTASYVVMDNYFNEYRTGGVAGSKHVDVTRGKRLVHGYKAVKGAEKTTNYSKGKPGVKVTPGYRLPHGYETTEAAYNEKYRTGGNLQDELQTNLAKKIYDNIYDFIEDANQNTDSPGYGIVLSNAPIFIQREGQIEFWEDIDLIQSECDCYFEISDYNDLVIKTDQYQGDEFRTGGVAGSKHVDVTRGRRLIHGYKAVKGTDKSFNYSKGHKGVKVTPGYRLPHGYETTEAAYNEKYRTGGVAGSKHVDVVRGYRLVHGYKAVKGSDKGTNYSKGYPKVKVDSGWRLPHGYEVVEAYYNDKYSRGGLFGSSAVVKDINDEFASDELKNELQSKMKKDDVVIAFAYTDYGGDFFDKVLIEYFEENYPDNIVVENTGWSGQNAFVFGTPAEEFVEATENYPLGFEDTESYYYEKQYEEEQEGFERFIEDDLRDYDFDTSEVMQELNEKFGGYWSVLTTGLDYSYSDMIDHLKEKGLIKEKAAKGKNVKKETLLDKIKSAGAISENQVNLVKNRMNRGAIDSETQEVIDYVHNDEVKLTPEQNQKGIKFLRNLYKSPTGKVRTNNPFGSREISALDSFTHFLIVGFQNIGNSYRDNYVPVYAVIGKNGTFEYYYDGDVNVVGAKGMQYRTGGVAGSKHVDVAKGYRLPHGYQAVKGADKNFDYSKGYPKVKVDKGWRLPKGYEVVDGAYNMKYDTGGNFDAFLEENEENDNWYNDNWFYEQYKNNKFMVQIEHTEIGEFDDATEMTIDEIVNYIKTSLKDGQNAIYSAHESIIKKNGKFVYSYGDGAYGGEKYINQSQIKENVISGIRADVTNYLKELPVGYSSSSSSNITESQYHRAVNHFVYFCMNYPSNFMDAFGNMKEHLQSKFNYAYEKYGSVGAMIRFYTELDSENQKALLSWAMNNYKGTKLEEGGMMETDMLSSFDIMKKGKNVDSKCSYTILKANRAYCGVHDKTYSEALSAAKSHQCGDGLIIKGEMIWTNGRVKGIRLADGEEMMYGEYEREYFTEPQMKELKKISKLK